MRLKRCFTFNRNLTTIAFVKVLVDMWWRHDPAVLDWIVFVLVGLVMSLAMDRILAMADVITDRYSNALVKLIVGGGAITSFWVVGLLATVVAPMALSDGLPHPEAIMSGLCESLLPDRPEPPTRRTHFNAQVTAYSPKHGAHALHPLSQTLLYFNS